MRLRRARRFQWLALTAALALVLAACGDGRDDDSAGGEGSSDTTSASGGDGGGGGGFEIDTANCVTDPSTVELSGDTIKVGTSLPQSGTYAAFAPMLRGAQAYIDYLNAEKGGVDIGGTKYQIELVNKDDAYAAEQTFSNVQQLVEDDDVFALVNVVGTKNNLAIRDYVNENCIPNLLASTGSPAWGDTDYPWLLGTFLVPYPLEMKAFVDYLEQQKPDASIAVLRANDDFGASYSDTLKELVKGTDLTIADEQTYDPETSEVSSQMTSLAPSNADALVLGATLLACPNALKELGRSGWKPITYMSGTCTTKTLMGLAEGNGDGVISVATLMDSNDPQYDQNDAMTLYKQKVAQYAPGVDIGNGIVAYGWTVSAMLEEILSRVDEPNRLGVMQAARTVSDVSNVGLQLPDSTWSVDGEDWYLGENFDMLQFSNANNYFSPLGERIDLSGQTKEITPPNLIQ
jgi:branched-chain amino acid transport system substrate-binding protein